MELSNSTAVVTGVTSGIGLALTEKLVGLGATVFGVGRQQERLSLLQRRLGASFRPVCVDLSQPSQRRLAIAQLEEACHPVDIFVSNAGECVFTSPLQTEPKRLAELFEVNVLAGMEFAHAIAPKMQPGSHLIHVSSVTTRFVAGPNFATYAATKCAAEKLVEGLRLELHPRGISVSTVLPGLVETNIYDKVPDFGATRRKLEQQIPKWLTAEDVAEIVLWLLRQPQHVVVSELVVLPRGQAR